MSLKLIGYRYGFPSFALMAATMVIIKSNIPSPIRNGIPIRIIENSADTIKKIVMLI